MEVDRKEVAEEGGHAGRDREGIGRQSVAGERRRDDAASTGNAPLEKSSTNTSTPKRRPSTRPTLVAPMLPLPWRRMSTPRKRATSQPNGTPPIR